MDNVMQFLQTMFNPLVVVFTVSTLASMGLQVELGKMIKKVANPKFLGTMFGLGWVVGPALAYLITLLIPLDNTYKIVLFIASLAPCAPFLPPLLPKAQGDIVFAGAFIPVAAICTSLLMPLFAPFLVQGIELEVMSLLKPIFVTVLLPLLICALIKTYASKVADQLFKPVKALAVLSSLVTTVFCIVLYYEQMWNTAGSFATLALTIFMVVMALICFYFPFGLNRGERVVLALGMGTRNIAAVLIGVLTIPDVPPNMVAMVIIWTVWSLILSIVVAQIVGKNAGKTVPAGAA